MGTDRVTKVLLGVIAAGIWALVLIQGVTVRQVKELHVEVKAIGVDTERIHEDLDPGGENEDDDRTMSGHTSTHGPAGTQVMAAGVAPRLR